MVPLRLVPHVNETNSPKFKNPIPIDIVNEKGEKCEKFGWCIISRKGAGSYCKDSRVPVCSKEYKF